MADSIHSPWRYRRAVGTFIHELAEWRIFATLTFADVVGDHRAFEVLRQWLRTIAKEEFREHVVVAWVADYQLGGLPHFHCLLTAPASIVITSAACERLSVLWSEAYRKAGRTEIRKFDPKQGAAWYMARHREWDVRIACSRRPRCRRKRGCRETYEPL